MPLCSKHSYSIIRETLFIIWGHQLTVSFEIQMTKPEDYLIKLKLTKVDFCRLFIVWEQKKHSSSIISND